MLFAQIIGNQPVSKTLGLTKGAPNLTARTLGSHESSLQIQGALPPAFPHPPQMEPHQGPASASASASLGPLWALLAVLALAGLALLDLALLGETFQKMALSGGKLGRIGGEGVNGG